MSVRTLLAVILSAALLVACGGGISSLSPQRVANTAVAFARPAAKIALTPPTLSVAPGATAKVVVSEKGYAGTLTVTSARKTACTHIASWSPVSGKGPKLTVSVKGLKAGSCSIAFEDALKHTALLPVTVPVALDYIYTLTAANAIEQFVFKSDGTLAQNAPAYALPSSCIQADAIALSPAGTQAFVACYASGELLVLNINADHAITASPIAPAAVSGPVYIVAPGTGAPNKLYVDGTSQIAAFSYGATSLTPLATYNTARYPQEMAFYTTPQGNSALYVAAPDPVTCTNSYTAGAVEPWAQDSSGLLTEQPLIPVCATFYNVVAANDNLYWAGPTVYGGYSLNTNKPLTLSAPWKPDSGPNYGPGTMSVVVPQLSSVGGPAGTPSDSSDNEVSIAGSDGRLYIMSPNGTSLLTINVISGGYVIPTLYCHEFKPPIRIRNGAFASICWYIKRGSKPGSTSSLTVAAYDPGPHPKTEVLVSTTLTEDGIDFAEAASTLK